MEMDDTYQEMENAVLGAIILENWAFDEISADLKPYCFNSEANQHIYQAILDIKAEKGNIDYLLISEKLKAKGLLETVGGGFYIMSLTNKVASASNIESHARLVIEAYLTRKVKEICQRGLIKLSERGIDILEVYEDLKNQIDSSVSDVSGNKSFDTIGSISSEFLLDIQNKKDGIIPPSINSGLTEVDKYGGFNNSDLIYLGARPGMGKTAFVIKVLRNCALTLKKPCGIFSLEMTSTQLLRRIASVECRINGEELRTGKVSDYQMNQLHARMQELNKAPLYIDDKTNDIDMIKNKAKKMKRLHKIELLVIDYLGFIKAKGFRDKNTEITHISRELKELAKELDIPLLVLTQLNRNIEARPLKDRFPQLSDLRDSGSIEQDADQVMFLFRPDYYEVDTFFLNEVELDTKGKCFVSYAKNRHGVNETKLVGFRGEFTEFHNLYEPIPDQAPIQPNSDFLSQSF